VGLVDIANAVAPDRSVPLPSPIVRTEVTPDRTDIVNPDAIRQKLSQLPDEELTRLSHNTSRGLPAYKAIMEEMDRRAKAN